jgi:hypothetical protein
MLFAILSPGNARNLAGAAEHTPLAASHCELAICATQIGLLRHFSGAIAARNKSPRRRSMSTAFGSARTSELEIIRERLRCSCGVTGHVTSPHPMEAAVSEQAAGPWDQAQVVLVLLVVPHQDPAALEQPCECPLHYPVTWFVALGLVTRLPLLADLSDVPM